MKIAHLILGLGNGGAENMLLKLTKEHAKNPEIYQVVYVFSKDDYLLSKFENYNIEVKNISFKNGLLNVFLIARLVIELYKFKPNILQCWMYHAEFLGTIANFFYLKKNKLFWNIRCSELDWGNRSLINKFIFSLLVKFSNVPNTILCNTSKGIDNHVMAGYRSSKLKLLYNGFDLPDIPLNSKDLQKREEVFNKLKIPLTSKTIVMVARFNYVKDHKTLTKAFDGLLEDVNYEDTKLILIGDFSNTDIKNEVLKSRNKESIYLLGNINNVYEVIKCFDIGVLTSTHEGFPNVIGEYILSNLVVVATDVGEIRNILNQQTPFLVAPGDHKSLTKNFKTALSLSENDKLKIISNNKEKVVDLFSIKSIANQYLECYKKDLDV